MRGQLVAVALVATSGCGFFLDDEADDLPCLSAPEGVSGTSVCFDEPGDDFEFNATGSAPLRLDFDEPITRGPDYIELTKPNRGLAIADVLFDQLRQGAELTVELVVSNGGLQSPESGPHRLLVFETIIDTEPNELFLIGTSGPGCINPGPLVAVRAADVSESCVVPGFELDADAHHVVVTLDGDIIEFYGDGQRHPVAAEINMFSPPSQWPAGDDVLVFGNRFFKERAWLGRLFFAGVYNRALTLEEIQTRRDQVRDYFRD